MACNPKFLKQFRSSPCSDDDETAILAGQVELRTFVPRQRIYKIGRPGERAYVMVSGVVRVTTVDQDQQEVVVDEPAHGEFFGLLRCSSRLHTDQCGRTGRNCLPRGRPARHRDALAAKPLAGMDMLTSSAVSFTHPSNWCACGDAKC